MDQRAIVSLDMFLDTRYGTLRRLNPEVADALVGTEQYRKRNVDNFEEMTNGIIKQADYEELYAKRDEVTLLHSKMTDFVYMMRSDMKDATYLFDRGAVVTGLRLDVNLWPYKLTLREGTLIRQIMEHYMPRTSVKVNLVNIPPEELTPDLIENSYEMMAWYNHEDWLIPNTEALLKHKLPTTPLYTPQIATSGKLPPPDQEIRDPFLARSLVLSEWLMLHYISTGMACHNPAIRRLIESQPH